MRGHARVLSIATVSSLVAAAFGLAPSTAQAFPFSSGAIVYTRWASGTIGALIVANPDGSGARVLHPTAPGLSATSDIMEPVLSPDGSRVAFADKGSGAIWAADLDGSHVVRLSNPPRPSSDDVEPTWSPSGRELFFTRQTINAKSQIMSAWADGGGDSSTQFSAPDKDYSQPGFAPNGNLAFVRVGGTGPSGVYIWTGGIETFFAAGTQPSWSHDSSKLAYVRSAALFVKGLQGDEQLVGTSGLIAFHPSWADDGGRIVFSGTIPQTSITRVWTVDLPTLAVKRVDPESGADPKVQDWAPAWQTIHRTTSVRVGGADRVDTAVAASRLGYDAFSGAANGRRATAVVLSRSDTFADALSGSALAGSKGGPLLLTGTDALDQRTAQEIRRVLAPGGSVFLLGDTEALSAKVQAQVTGLGYTVHRLAGADRYATAAAIADAITPTPDKILVATGNNFPDALAAGAAAAHTPGTVVLLSDDRTLPAATAAYLNAHPKGELFGVGDQGVAALRSRPAPVHAVAGTDRFVTAADVAETFFTAGNAPHVVGLATGYNWPDALAGGALLGANAGPLLLSDKSTIPAPEADYARTEAGSIDFVVTNGDTGVVPAAAATTLANLVGVPGAVDSLANPVAPVLP